MLCLNNKCECLQVVTEAKEFAHVRDQLADTGLPIDEGHSGLIYMPMADIEVCDSSSHHVLCAVRIA